MTATAPGFWIHPHISYTDALFTKYPEVFADIQDDLASLVILSMLSFASGCLIWRITSRLWKAPPQITTFQRRFGCSSMALAVLHILGSIMFIAAFAERLRTAAKVTAVSSPVTDDWTRTTFVCIQPRNVTADCQWAEVQTPKSDFVFSTIVGSFMQAIIFIANGLLVYRAFDTFRKTRRVVWIIASVIYVASIAISIVFYCVPITFNDALRPAHDGPSYVVLGFATGLSVLVNLFVAVAIWVRVGRASRALQSLDGKNGQLAKPARKFSVMLDTGLPAAVVGAAICLVTLPLVDVGLDKVHSIRAVWISLLALTPSVMAVRSLHWSEER